MIDISKINIRRLMIIPALMLIVSLVIVGVSAKAGTMPMSIELKGGTMITAYDVPKGLELEDLLEKRFGFNVQVSTIRDFAGKVVGKNIQIDKTIEGEEKEEVRDFLLDQGIDEEKLSIGSVGPTFSEMVLRQAVKAVIFAFVFMAVVIFLRFKTFVPSFAVILSAFSDIVTTLAIMIILGIQLSPGSFVALLLLIGYSVDTDILLTTRLLVKKEKKVEERIARAMKTGLTMTATTLFAMAILFLVSTAVLLKEIASVILIGLFVDLINTWIQNVGILQWHIERRGLK
jgi:preprotein translocase subunit SecF